MAVNKSTIEIDGKNRGALVAINGVKKELLDLGRTAEGPLANALSMFGSNLSTAGITAAVGAIGLLIKNSIDAADELNKLSQKIGISVETLSTLKYAADLSDVSIEQLQTGIARLSKALYDVSQGSGKETMYALRNLGVSSTDANGHLRKTEDILFDVADKFSQLDDGVRKTGVAMNLFGRSGAEMIPFLNQGKKGIQELQKEARSLGLEISSTFGQRAEQFNDNLTTLQYVATGLGNSLAVSLMPALLDATNFMKVLATQTNTLSAVFQVVGIWAKIFATNLTMIYGVAGEVINVIEGLYNATKALFTGENMGKAWSDSFSDFGDSVSGAVDTVQKLWQESENYDDMLKRIQDEQQKLMNQQAAEKIRGDWEKLSNTLRRDVILDGLTPQNKLIMDLTLRVEEYRQKFGQIPGAMNQINEWYKTLIDNALRLDSITMEALRNRVMNNRDVPEESQPWINEFEKAKSKQSAQMALSQELTDFELMGIALREEATANAFGNMTSAMGAFYDASGQKSKQAFAMYKAFATAEALVSTYNAAVGAYASGAKIGGPILGAIYAAAAVAAGLANVARINSTQIGSGSGGGSPSATPSLPSGNSITNNNNSNTRNVNYTINIYGDATSRDDKDRLARELLDALEKAENDRMGR